MDFAASRKQAALNRRAFVALATPALVGFVGRPARAQDTLSSADAINSARLLSDHSTSLLHRLALIDAANHEILLASYEVGDDPVALRILAGLREAARRGVCVRLIVDGHSINNLMAKAMMQALIQQGVQIAEHMPDVRYQVELGRQRMHDKLLIVDGQRLIIGGRNVRADYYAMSTDPDNKNRCDREAYVTGPIVQNVRRYFLQRWSAGTTGQPTLDRDEKKKTIDAQVLDYLNELPRPTAICRSHQLLDESLTASLPRSKDCCGQDCVDCQYESFFELDCVRFLHDQPEHPKDCDAAIASQLNQAISAAKHSVLMETPYAVFTKQLRERLTELSKQGVAVGVVTNSLSTTDQVIVHAQYANERRWLQQAGIELWEIKGERMLHAKSLVIDGYRSMIGSYNFDVLSETRNSETAVLIDDRPFAEALIHKIGHDLYMAEPVAGALIGYDARTNDVESQRLREARLKRLISPWIKKYL